MKEKIKQILKKLPGGFCLGRLALTLGTEFFSIFSILRCLYARIVFRENTIILSGWIFCKKGKVVSNNWGDDINVSFLSESTGKKVLVYPITRIARWIALENFVLIGSIINSAPNRNSIIWGSGLINDKLYQKLPSIPKKILAVRGPLTRDWVLSQGVHCPPVYGDPALLLPRFYTPKGIPRARVGIIPHHADLENGNAVVTNLTMLDGVRLIRVQGYGNWRDFVDEICSCDFVVSASLHGLIVAEAYGVPSLWVEFSEHIPGWDFKFRDFYASIGKSKMEPLRVDSRTKFEDLLAWKSFYRPGIIDTDALLKECPFVLCRVPARG